MIAHMSKHSRGQCWKLIDICCSGKRPFDLQVQQTNLSIFVGLDLSVWQLILKMSLNGLDLVECDLNGSDWHGCGLIRGTLIYFLSSGSCLSNIVAQPSKNSCCKPGNTNPQPSEPICPKLLETKSSRGQFSDKALVLLV